VNDVRELDVLDHWWRPGALPRWVTWTLALATLTTILVAHLGARHLADYLDPSAAHSGFWMREGPAIGVALALALCWWPRWRLSRAVRVAVLLPAVQLASIGVAMVIWRMYSARLPDAALASPLVRALPFSLFAVCSGVFVLGASRAIADGRRGEWLHAAATLAVVQLLLVGLWLPVVATAWCANDTPSWYSWDDVARAIASPSLITWVLAPPTVIATVFTTFAIRRYELIRAWRGAILIATLVLLVTATAVRMNISLHDSLLYANFVHIVLALAVVAGAALIALAISLWTRARRHRRALLVDPVTGVIARDGVDGPVACLQIAGWLRGPRVITRGFTVNTDAGAIAVPCGVTLVGDPPEVSTKLASGEAVPVLRTGDRVVLAGFVAPPSDHPFRSSSALIPGDRGIFVAREIERPSGFAGVTLSMWRPGLAFLIVVVSIALPALVGALAQS
jgi:hypothetical protein